MGMELKLTLSAEGCQVTTSPGPRSLRETITALVSEIHQKSPKIQEHGILPATQSGGD